MDCVLFYFDMYLWTNGKTQNLIFIALFDKTQQHACLTWPTAFSSDRSPASAYSRMAEKASSQNYCSWDKLLFAFMVSVGSIAFQTPSSLGQQILSQFGMPIHFIWAVWFSLFVVPKKTCSRKHRKAQQVYDGPSSATLHWLRWLLLQSACSFDIRFIIFCNSWLVSETYSVTVVATKRNKRK